MFEPPLDALECRILGCLVEKQLSTPEYYPLTLKALVSAFNQSSNRDPVMAVDEESAIVGLEGLRRRGMIYEVSTAGSRVLKYEHRLEEALHLSVQESAILAELLLRGPQTPGELRSRCTRMYEFQDLAEVEAGLQALMEAEVPLAMRMQRAPGAREARIAQLLTGPVETDAPGAPMATPAPSRVAQLEGEIEQLKLRLAELRGEFEAFKSQF